MSLTRPWLVLIVAAFAATISLLPNRAPEAAGQRRVVVEIRRLAFDPPRLALRVGDVVVWRNLDIVPHTATSKGGSFDSGVLEPGAEWSLEFTEAMPGVYYCLYHPTMIAKLALDPG